MKLNGKTEEYLIKGYSDWTDVWFITLIGIMLIIVFGKTENGWNLPITFSISIITIIAQILRTAKYFFSYEIYENTTKIIFPLTKKIKEIPHRQLVSVNFGEKEDEDPSGLSLLGIWLYYKEDLKGKLKKQKLPLQGLSRKKTIRILGFFQDKKIEINLPQRHKKIRKALKQLQNEN
jgi:hypothetical protein